MEFNFKRLDKKGRPFKKLDSTTYTGMKHYTELRKWGPVLSSKGNLNRYYKAGLR